MGAYAYCARCCAPLDEPTLAEAFQGQQHCPWCGHERACSVHEVNNAADSLEGIVGEHERRIVELELTIAKLQLRVDRIEDGEL